MKIQQQLEDLEKRKRVATTYAGIAESLARLGSFGVRHRKLGNRSGETLEIIIGAGNEQEVRNWLPCMEFNLEVKEAFQCVCDSINDALDGIIQSHVEMWEKRAEDAISGPPQPVVNVQAPAGVTVNVQQG